MMGGEIKWSSLDLISEYLHVNDMELLIDGLMELSKSQQK